MATVGTIKKDVIKGAKVRREKGQITSATATYIATGFSGYTTSASLEAAVVNHADVPNYGDLYPGTTNVECYALDWDADDRLDGGIVTASYQIRNFGATDSQPDELQYGVSGGATLVQVETEIDIYGDAITCPAPITKSEIDELNEPQTGTVTKYEAQDTIYYKTQIVTSQPGVIQRRYSGKINSAEFQGDAPLTWLCAVTWDLVAVDQDTGAYTYEFYFYFQYAKDGWNPLITYRDENGNRDSRVEINGYSSYESGHTKDGWNVPEVYELIDFNTIFSL